MIKRTPLVELQTAIYQHFKNSGAPIFEDLHDLVEFPRIVIGEFSGKKEGSKSTNGQTVILTLHLYSKEEGKEEINGLINNTIKCLSLKLPPLDRCFSIIGSWVESYEVYPLEDEDGNFACYHATIDVQFMIQDFGKTDSSEINW